MCLLRLACVLSFLLGAVVIGTAPIFTTVAQPVAVARADDRCWFAEERRYLDSHTTALTVADGTGRAYLHRCSNGKIVNRGVDLSHGMP
jgi:hypothetical protein